MLSSAGFPNVRPQKGSVHLAARKGNLRTPIALPLGAGAAAIETTLHGARARGEGWQHGSACLRAYRWNA